MNNKIIEKLKANIDLTNEEHDFISSHYKFLKNPTKQELSYSWVCVCRPGSDSKYGHYYICPEKMLMRSSTFDEFYSGGIVD